MIVEKTFKENVKLKLDNKLTHNNCLFYFDFETIFDP